MGPRPAVTSPRMVQLLDAGVAVVAAHGLRGLTHRAVDREAGLPEGSCSAYLRTRGALLAALTAHVSAQLAGDVAELADALATTPGDHGRARREVSALFEKWLQGPELLARFELGLEATRDPALAAQFYPWHDRLTDVVAGALDVAGRGEVGDVANAEVLVASLEGVLLRSLVRPPAERVTLVRGAVAMLIDGLAPAEG